MILRSDLAMIRTLALVLLLCGSARAEVIHGVVVAIADGDTATVLVGGHDQHKVRLAGIDAPEKGQPFGQRARQNLGALLFGKQVRVEWAKHDRYGRIVGKVWVEAPDAPCVRTPGCPKTLDAGLAQVTSGLAWWFRKYAQAQSAEDRERYERAEFEAKIRRLGLWAEQNPTPPWDWRRDR